MKDMDGRLTWIMMNGAMVTHPHDRHLRELHERYNKRHISLVARSHLAIKMSTHIYHMMSKRELYKFHEDMCKDKMSKLNTLSGN